MSYISACPIRRQEAGLPHPCTNNHGYEAGVGGGNGGRWDSKPQASSNLEQSACSQQPGVILQSQLPGARERARCAVREKRGNGEGACCEHVAVRCSDGELATFPGRDVALREPASAPISGGGAAPPIHRPGAFSPMLGDRWGGWGGTGVQSGRNSKGRSRDARRVV